VTSLAEGACGRSTSRSPRCRRRSSTGRRGRPRPTPASRCRATSWSPSARRSTQPRLPTTCASSSRASAARAAAPTSRRVALVSSDLVIRFRPRLPLPPGRTFIAHLGGSPRDAGGTPTWRAVLVELHHRHRCLVERPGRPSKIHLLVPVDGVATIVLEPGACRAPPTASPGRWRRGSTPRLPTRARHLQRRGPRDHLTVTVGHPPATRAPSTPRSG